MVDRYANAETGNDTTGDGSLGNPYATMAKCNGDLAANAAYDSNNIVLIPSAVDFAPAAWLNPVQGTTIRSFVPGTKIPIDASATGWLMFESTTGFSKYENLWVRDADRDAFKGAAMQVVDCEVSGCAAVGGEVIRYHITHPTNLLQRTYIRDCPGTGNPIVSAFVNVESCLLINCHGTFGVIDLAAGFDVVNAVVAYCGGSYAIGVIDADIISCIAKDNLTAHGLRRGGGTGNYRYCCSHSSNRGLYHTAADFLSPPSPISSITTDPLFVDDTGDSAGDYRIQPGVSPCEATGDPVLSAVLDIDGLPFGTPPSMGAYEIVIPPDPTIPTPPTDTGPDTVVFGYDAPGTAVSTIDASDLNIGDLNEYRITFQFTGLGGNTMSIVGRGPGGEWASNAVASGIADNGKVTVGNVDDPYFTEYQFTATGGTVHIIGWIAVRKDGSLR